MPKFQTGEVHNPLGRPKGTGHRQKVFNHLVLPYRENLIQKAISMAMEGDQQMLKLFLERILPSKPVDEPIQLKLTSGAITLDSFKEIGENALHSLERGENTPEQVKALFDILKSYTECIAFHDLANKAKELEEQFNKFQNKQLNTTEFNHAK